MANEKKAPVPEADASAAGLNGVKAIQVEASEHFKRNQALREQAEKAGKAGLRNERSEVTLGVEPSVTEAGEASTTGRRTQR